MPYARSRARGSSRWVVVVLVCLFLPLAAAGTVGTLWAFGKVDPIAWFSRRDQLPPGFVPVLASGMKIPAYTKITRDHLIDPKTGRFAFVPVPEGEIPKEAILSPNEVIGRVLNHNKPSSYLFTERDFFPKGTRAGLSGAIPSGKVSLTLERTKIQGIAGLEQQEPHRPDCHSPRRSAQGQRESVEGFDAADANRPDGKTGPRAGAREECRRH